MFHKILYAVWILIGMCGLVCAEEITKFDRRDFYFYDEENLITRLRLAPKIIVHFFTALPPDQRDFFLKEFSPIDRKDDPGNSFRQIIRFAPSTSEQRIFDMLTDINRSGIARGIPVVFIDNIEAIAEGFVVEPRTPLSPETLSQHLKKIGEFSINQTKQENNAWLFIIDDVKPPLHIYSLINLIHEDAWVKSVRPQFTYLHAPVIATLKVTPISGTVDETRIITLSVYVFDDRIKIRDDLLPQFGEGKFIPNPLPPSLFFFSAVGEKRIPRVRTNMRGYMMSLQWQFRIFAVGEWTVPSQIIAYERQGEQFTISSSQGPFVVTSIVGSLVITDMPSPKDLPVPEKRDLPFPEKIPQLPSYWFDQWITQPLYVATYSFFAALVLVTISVGFLIVWGIAVLRKSARKKLEINMLITGWRNICREAGQCVCVESYRKLQEVLWHMLALAFPNMLPRNPGLKDIETGVRNSFDDDRWDILCLLYEELEYMHAKDFMPDKDVLCEIIEKITLVMDYLIPKIQARKRML